MAAEISYKPGELLRNIAEGDSDAFTHLFDKYWLQVFAHVRTYIKDNAAAEDITQDIFFSIWLNRSKLATVQDFEPWLHVVTRNRTISGLRKMLHEPDGGISATVPEIAAQQSDSPVGQLDYKQSRELLQKAIDQLPERRRQVFRMSRQDGLTHAEIAEQLQISKATVNEHIGEALAFLKTRLAAYPGLLNALLLISGCWLGRK
ncbi:RNA polymerase sigma-70 factor [Pseudoflavitalea sp. G-6-1-2]|uniref:RNA polymerase sigma-70 factor n=1 Tax=Pseudoflavitalea sp. G-6-1-2 TaxID=2728841 RepID=UPI00146DFC99|nr:RNA polymerase sigma-70 factor [Pseudoflavitalea sp. G-6-1-2]NML22730.1 RNA polymerase sigma-70 factor [Pseudoflavitalea sp. G-6-1-2]